MTASSSEPEATRAPRGWWAQRLGTDAVSAYLERFVVPGGATAWTRALGGALASLLVVEVLTGLLLLLYYRPDLSQAHASVSHIVQDVRFGWLLRSIHRTNVHAIVVVALLHGATSYLHRSFRRPRELTWWTGGLLVATLAAFAYSGSILPWDRGALYAAQVGTSLFENIPWVGPALASILRGGPTIGAATVHRAFALHLGLLPAVSLALVLLHVHLVHAHGLTPASRGDSRSLRSFLPHAVASWLVLLTVVVVVAALAPPSHGPAADLADASSVARPAWYFMALFELARSNVFAGAGAVFVPLAAAVLLAAAPYWSHGRRGRVALWVVGLVLIVGSVALTFAGYGG